MSVDWDVHFMSCGGAVTASKKKKVKKCKSCVKHDDLHPTPQISKALVSIPPNRRTKKIKRLKPDKWKAAFDAEGRPLGFHKLLKAIRKGGVDQSIRPEVWEFLLGCYALGTTSAYRELLRHARRERYKELIEKCQMMHSSVGTGSLAYTVGSKLMDVRVMSKESARKEATLGVQRIDLGLQELSSGQVVQATQQQFCQRFDMPLDHEDFKEVPILEGKIGSDRDGSSEVKRRDADADPSIISENSGSLANEEGDYNETSEAQTRNLDLCHPNTSEPFGFVFFDSLVESSSTYDCDRRNSPTETQQLEIGALNSLRQREPLPGQIVTPEPPPPGVTSAENDVLKLASTEVKPKLKDVDVAESVDTKAICDLGRVERSTSTISGIQSPLETSESMEDLRKGDRDRDGQIQDKRMEKRTASFANLPTLEPVVALGMAGNEERVGVWLWTLHRIVVDVVRTDKHLEFYREVKNSARMSDILAVYAWVDPSTGYCQGMSDLLSPFVVLFDDDADAFWCFESLLKRVRHNFQMDGPVGVMKQLEALSKIFELTDVEMLEHLVLAGADSFLFAFRMLLVLFRRELSFGEAFYMWEMMWAADFDQATVWALEYQTLDALVLKGPILKAEMFPVDKDSNPPETSSVFVSSERLHRPDSLGPETFGWKAFAKGSSFCGLRPRGFWLKHQNRMVSAEAGTLLGEHGDEDISVFCVAAIIEQNRAKVLKKIQSMDDAIKMFNDMDMNMNVHSCVHLAVNLRKRYRSQVPPATFMHLKPEVECSKHEATLHLLCKVLLTNWDKSRT